MADGIRAGFTMHPRWVEGTDLHTFLEPLRQAGLSALEFELDTHLDLWNEFEPLMETAVNQGMELSFHAPYREPHTLTGFAGNKRNDIERDYRPMLEIAERWAVRAGSPWVVVFHAATAYPPHDRKSLIEDTVAFLNWVGEEFPQIRIALENNSPSSDSVIKLGVKHDDVLSLIKRVNRLNLGICWDMGHDYLQGGEQATAAEWLASVIHVHLHDVDESGLDHYPLVLGRTPYPGWLRALKTSGMKGLIVLELKGERLLGWPLKRIRSALIESVLAIVREVS